MTSRIKMNVCETRRVHIYLHLCTTVLHHMSLCVCMCVCVFACALGKMCLISNLPNIIHYTAGPFIIALAFPCGKKPSDVIKDMCACASLHVLFSNVNFIKVQYKVLLNVAFAVNTSSSDNLQIKLVLCLNGSNEK